LLEQVWLHRLAHRRARLVIDIPDRLGLLAVRQLLVLLAADQNVKQRLAQVAAQLLIVALLSFGHLNTLAEHAYVLTNKARLDVEVRQVEILQATQLDLDWVVRRRTWIKRVEHRFDATRWPLDRLPPGVELRA